MCSQNIEIREYVYDLPKRFMLNLRSVYRVLLLLQVLYALKRETRTFQNIQRLAKPVAQFHFLFLLTTGAHSEKERERHLRGFSPTISPPSFQPVFGAEEGGERMHFGPVPLLLLLSSSHGQRSL